MHREFWQPDFDLLFSILDFAVSFPATFHLPKEEDYLFKAVRLGSPDSGPILDELLNDHAEGLDLISELRDSLETYDGRPAAGGWFHDAAKNYSRHEREHMRREERTVLPLALQVLSKEDWVEIDAAFGQNEHPLFRAGRRENFDKLFALILRRMPGTVVFGSGQKRAA